MEISYTLSYTMSYIISYTISFSQAETMCRPAVPVPLRAPDSGDEDGDRPLNSDDELDFQDQQSPPPSPMQHYPTPQNSIARFLCDVPDWSVLDKNALDKAISQLHFMSSPEGCVFGGAIVVRESFP